MLMSQVTLWEMTINAKCVAAFNILIGSNVIIEEINDVGIISYAVH